jgi:hypothetical protein
MWRRCPLSPPSTTIYTARVFLLRYRRDGQVCVVILEGISVAHARMAAAWLEPGTFLDGRRVNRTSAARVPSWAVGRVLTAGELAALVADKKKPPAPSVRRRRAGAAAR